MSRVPHRSNVTGAFLLTLAAIVTTAPIHAADVANDGKKAAAIEKDRERIHGTWRIVALTINGNEVAVGEGTASNLTVVNGDDGTWQLRSNGNEVAGGTSTFDPLQRPKTIDFRVIEDGQEGEVCLGIYELGEKKRKICFAPAGKPRPEAFEAAAGSDRILALFERIQSKKPE